MPARLTFPAWCPGVKISRRHISGRSGRSQRISWGGSIWVGVAGLGEWSAPGK